MMRASTTSASALFGIGLLASPASAQSFTYADFTSTAGLNLKQQAGAIGPVLRVHDQIGTGGDNMGAAWYSTPVSVVNGFDTTFEFNINGTGNGDGMAFVIQNDLVAGYNGMTGANAIGRHASACGYGLFVSSAAGESIDNSIAIEIDHYRNDNQPAANPIRDPDDNHISIHTGGNAENQQIEAYSIGRASSATLGTQVDNGVTHTVRVLYVPGTLEVYFNGNLVITTPYDFNSGGTWIDSGTAVGGLDLIGGTSAYVGFTGSGAGNPRNHDIESWSFSSAGGIGQNYCMANANSSGGPSSMSASGSLVAADNNFTLGANGLPANQFGIFVTSMTQGFVPGASGTSNGNLCVGGVIGRFSRPGQIVSSGATGQFSLPLDLTDIPQGNGTVTIMAGQTWNFQAWHRDGVGLGSNFTDGLEVAFQ